MAIGIISVSIEKGFCLSYNSSSSVVLKSIVRSFFFLLTGKFQTQNILLTARIYCNIHKIIPICLSKVPFLAFLLRNRPRKFPYSLWDPNTLKISKGKERGSENKID